MVRVRALVAVPVPEVVLVVAAAEGLLLLVLRLLDQVVDDVLVVLQLVELVLLEVDGDGLVVAVVVVEEVAGRRARLVGLEAGVDGEAVQAQVDRLEVLVLNEQGVHGLGVGHALLVLAGRGDACAAVLARDGLVLQELIVN